MLMKKIKPKSTSQKYLSFCIKKLQKPSKKKIPRHTRNIQIVNTKLFEKLDKL